MYVLTNSSTWFVGSIIAWTSIKCQFILSFTASEPKVIADTEDVSVAELGEMTLDEDVESAEETSVTKNVSSEAAVVPSAPVFDEDLKHCDVKSQVQYPDLKSMQKQEEKTQSGLRQRAKERITLKPFNERQLKELYHNPELALADEFESEFISTELNCTYKDHSLYELLKRYSQCRYNLKINMLDLHSFKRSFEENSENVWKIEKRELKYNGTCADGERIFKTEVYA